MAEITTQKELPAGVMRSSFGSRIVLLVDSKLPFSQNEEIMKLANTISPLDIILRFWVFSIVKEAFDKKEDTLIISLPSPHLVRSAGFNTYEGAEAKYEEWAKEDDKDKSIARGIEGLRKIGKEE